MKDREEFNNYDLRKRCSICYARREILYYLDEAYFCPDCEDVHAGYLCKECYEENVEVEDE